MEKPTTKYSYYPNCLMQNRNASGSATQFYYNSNQQVVSATDGTGTTAFLLVGAQRYASYAPGAGMTLPPHNGRIPLLA